MKCFEANTPKIKAGDLGLIMMHKGLGWALEGQVSPFGLFVYAH